MNMFEKATRLKFRFETPGGHQSVEDLWDLPLQSTVGKPNLDAIARDLARKLKDTDTESFVETPNKADAILQLKFDVVKHIIDVKLAERDAEKTRRENKEKKEQVLALIADKQVEELKGKSVEELKQYAASL
jgi:hypothetical protein